MKGFAIIIFIMSTVFMVSGCSSKFPSLFLNSWSENYAFVANGAEASLPEINDGKLDTWGITQPPDRVYTITLPEEKKVNRIVVYSGNVIAYQLFCWNKEINDWKLVGSMDITTGRRKAQSDRQELSIPQFDHRVNLRTDKIKLQVTRAESDGTFLTRTPGKNDRILNQRIEYIGEGRNRKRVDFYEVFVEGPAAIREIQIYSHAEKTKS